jgi:hypothetical protein
MLPRILSTSSLHALKRRAPASAIWLIILVLLVIISLGCLVTPTSQISKATSARPLEFERTDCSLAGVKFSDITISYNIDDTYAGPYLICSSSSQGTHDLSVSYYLSIIAYKADMLEAFYNELLANIQGFVDQSEAWNADPSLPAEAKDEITFIEKDPDGYVFMITSWSNVQECENGNGYGAEKVLGKYLVSISYRSCELPDAAAYSAVLKSLDAAAKAAIFRVEGVSIP